METSGAFAETKGSGTAGWLGPGLCFATEHTGFRASPRAAPPELQPDTRTLGLTTTDSKTKPASGRRMAHAPPARAGLEVWLEVPPRPSPPLLPSLCTRARTRQVLDAQVSLPACFS